MSPDELAWAKAEFARCEKWLQAALDKSLGEYALEHVWDYIESGKAQIWPTPNACMITCVDDYPTGLRILKWWLAGGDDLSEIQLIEPTVCAWAKKAGCTQSVISGRRGWVRAITGYHIINTTIAKDL